MNNKIIIIFLIIFSFSKLYANNIIDYQNDKYTKYSFKTENPFRNIDSNWIKEDLRIQKLIIACGVITLAAGFPILLSGLLNTFIPNTDIPEYSKTTYYVLSGVGGGLAFVGSCITIGGGISYGIARKKIKTEVSLLGLRIY